MELIRKRSTATKVGVSSVKRQHSKDQSHKQKELPRVRRGMRVWIFAFGTSWS